MSTFRWLLAVPLALAATLGTARASSVRDEAGMFSPGAVRKAEAELNRVEAEHKIATTIETVDSLQGQDIADVSLRKAEQSGEHGIFILIARKEHQIYNRVSSRYSRAITPARQRAFREAFEPGFKAGDFDAGLLQGVRAVGEQVAAAHASAGVRQGGAPPVRGMPVRRGNPGGGFGVGSLLGLGLLILGVLFVVRLLGGLFGGGYRGQPGRYGAPGYGGGYGRGGGFMSSLFGGIGGAMAGNWLYDQFSGRHAGGGTYDAGSAAGSEPSAPDDWAAGTGGGSDWGGGDMGGGGGDWGGGGGGDWGGGGGGDGGSW